MEVGDGWCGCNLIILEAAILAVKYERLGLKLFML